LAFINISGLRQQIQRSKFELLFGTAVALVYIAAAAVLMKVWRSFIDLQRANNSFVP
jgi:hypothetical protein